MTKQTLHACFRVSALRQPLRIKAIPVPLAAKWNESALMLYSLISDTIG